MGKASAFAASCFGRCLSIFLYDHLCFTLPKDLLKKFVFIDSRGTEHELTFWSNESIQVTGVAPGMGKLIFKGAKEKLAEACGFTVEEDGKEKYTTKQICKEKYLEGQKKDALLIRKVVTFHELNEGIDIEVADKRACTRAFLRFQVGDVDWLVHMAWMDNHSGNCHGSGHFGVMIVNGNTGKGLYADFGKYHVIKKGGVPHDGDGSNQDHREVKKELEEEFDMIRISKEVAVSFTDEGLFTDAIAKTWSDWNESYGSGVLHFKKCLLIPTLKGPNHEWTMIFPVPTGLQKVAHPPYRVDGVLGWAAIRLRRGAYERMKRFIYKCRTTAEYKWGRTKEAYRKQEPGEAPKNQYGVFSFNCMTFGLCVYEVGANPNHTMKGDLSDRVDYSMVVDHPNADIQDWIAMAGDGGYFYSREYFGNVKAFSGEAQNAVTNIRQKRPDMVN